MTRAEATRRARLEFGSTESLKDRERVRVALGAMPRQIVATTFKRSFVQMALGIGIGALVLSVLIVSASEKLNLQALGKD